MNPLPENRPAPSSTDALWEIIQARDQALADMTSHYEPQLEVQRKELKKLSNYLAEVEADRAERLKSIEFYQDKLKTAYTDLERNVAYLKKLEEEIQLHIKVQADKDAIISQLTAQIANSTSPKSSG